MIPAWQELIEAQYRRPSGLIGYFIGARMVHEHLPEHLWTLGLLQPRPADRILEVGFGAGSVISLVEQAGTAGIITGIDLSLTMVRAARRRNRRAVDRGRVLLANGDAAYLPFATASFDKAFAIHSIYFWPQPVQALVELHRVLSPGGSLILTVLPKEHWPADSSGRVGTSDCRPYDGDELQGMLDKAGFARGGIFKEEKPEAPSSFSVVGVKEPN